MQRLVIGLLSGLAVLPALARAVPVEVVRTDDGFELLRGGEPYAIRGSGGGHDLGALVAAGGNSIRTWGVGPETQEILDRAHELGVTVTVGLWLGHERHGFDYHDADQLAAQMDMVRDAVLAFRDHPAVVAWGVGNEMEEDGTNAAIWSHVEAVAAMVKRLDPHHPTMTVIADLGRDAVKLRNIMRLCPSVDIVGINSYGGAASVPERARAAGLDRPYVVTEFGPVGFWETGRTSWGAAYEQTSSQKADVYAAAVDAFDADPRCLGHYAFLWGNKQEATSTWFGMILPTGERLAAVDAMERRWTGREPANRAPLVDPLRLVGRDVRRPGETFTVRLDAEDPDGDGLRVEWVVMREADRYGSGGDAEPVPPTARSGVVSGADRLARIRLTEPGAYRVFAYVYDGNGAAGTANVPVHIGPVPEGATR